MAVAFFGACAVMALFRNFVTFFWAVVALDSSFAHFDLHELFMANNTETELFFFNQEKNLFPILFVFLSFFPFNKQQELRLNSFFPNDVHDQESLGSCTFCACSLVVEET